MEQYVSRNDGKVPRRVLGALLASVSAGVVPRTGAPYIAIGRTEEITAIASDLARVRDGEGAMRFIIGRYGSGKSFLMQLVRGYAAENGFVTADADLSPERRLTGSGGVGVATYRELAFEPVSFAGELREEKTGVVAPPCTLMYLIATSVAKSIVVTFLSDR